MGWWGLSLQRTPWRPRLGFDRFYEPILNPFIKDWSGRVSPLFFAWHPIRRERSYTYGLTHQVFPGQRRISVRKHPVVARVPEGSQAGRDACSMEPLSVQARERKARIEVLRPVSSVGRHPPVRVTCMAHGPRQQGPSGDSSRASLTPVPPATTTTSQTKRSGRCRAVLVTITPSLHHSHPSAAAMAAPCDSNHVDFMLFSYRGIKDWERNRENATSSCGNSQSKPNAVRMRELCILRSLNTIKLLPRSECPLPCIPLGCPNSYLVLPPLPRSFSRLLTFSRPPKLGQP